MTTIQIRALLTIALLSAGAAGALDAQAPDAPLPAKAGDRLFYTATSGPRDQGMLYLREGARPPRVLIDPGTLSGSGSTALTLISASPNGKYMGYGVTAGASDWQELRVRNVDTGRDLRDTLKNVKRTDISWTRDNRGFFYSGYGQPGSTQKVFYHRLGTPQSADLVIYERGDEPDWLFTTRVSDDGVFAIITIHEGADPKSRLYYVYLDNPKRPRVNNPVVRVAERDDAEYEFVDSSGDYLLVRTTLGAPKGKLIRIDINNLHPSRWVTIIPEGDNTLVKVAPAENHLVVLYLDDGRSSMRVYGMPRLDDPRLSRGQSGPRGRMPAEIGDRAPPPSTDRRAQTAPGYPFIREIPLPAPGTVTGISSTSDDDEMFFSFVPSGAPAAIYRYDVKRGTTEPFNPIAR